MKITERFIVTLCVFALLGFLTGAVWSSPMGRSGIEPSVFDVGLLPAGKRATVIVRAVTTEHVTTTVLDSISTSCGCVTILYATPIEKFPRSVALVLSVDPSFVSDEFSATIRVGKKATRPTLSIRGRVTPLFEGWPDHAVVRDGILTINDVYAERISDAVLIAHDGIVMPTTLVSDAGGTQIVPPPVDTLDSLLLALRLDDKNTAQWSGPVIEHHTFKGASL